jgi:hypothetical protein
MTAVLESATTSFSKVLTTAVKGNFLFYIHYEIKNSILYLLEISFSTTVRASTTSTASITVRVTVGTTTTTITTITNAIHYSKR